jgi:hypothetical protein
VHGAELEVRLSVGIYALLLEGPGNQEGIWSLMVNCPTAGVVVPPQLAGRGDIFAIVVHADEVIEYPNVDITWDDLDRTACVGEGYTYTAGSCMTRVSVFPGLREGFFFGNYMVTSRTHDATATVTVSGIVDLAGNNGATTASSKITVDTRAPKYKLVLTSNSSAGVHTAQQGDVVTGIITADEPVLLPRVSVNGKPIIVHRSGQRIAARECTGDCVINTLFSVGDTNSDGVLAFFEYSKLIERARLERISWREFSSLAFLRGFDPMCSDDAERCFDEGILASVYTGMPAAQVQHDFDILVGTGGVSTSWQFATTIRRDTPAGVLQVAISEVQDPSNNVAAKTTAAEVDMTIVCRAGEWGRDSVCKAWTECNESEYELTRGNNTHDRACQFAKVCRGRLYWNRLALRRHFSQFKMLLSRQMLGLLSDFELLSTLKSMSNFELLRWFDSRLSSADTHIDYESFVAGVASVRLEFTRAAATATSDTICAPVTICAMNDCKMLVKTATPMTDAVCSLPCNGHGTCDAAVGSCTCQPTCTDSNNAIMFEGDQTRCEQAQGGTWSDWVGSMCASKKILGCLDGFANNTDPKANAQAPAGSSGACIFASCRQNLCQNDAVCQMKDPSVNVFECSCPRYNAAPSALCETSAPPTDCLFVGKRCAESAIRTTDPARFRAGGRNLKGAKTGANSMFTLLPKTQFDEPRTYDSMEEQLHDLSKLQATIHGDLSGTIDIRYSRAKGVFEIHYSILQESQAARITIRWEDSVVVDTVVSVTNAIGPPSHMTSELAMAGGDEEFVTAGDIVEITVKLRDANGQALKTSGDAAALSASLARTGQSSLGPISAIASIRDLPGTYRVAFKTDNAGMYTLDVSLTSAGSAFNFVNTLAPIQITPGPTAASNCQVFQLTYPIVLRALETLSFKVLAFDKYDNRNTNGVLGSNFKATLPLAEVTIAETLGADGMPVFPVSYRVTATVGPAGRYQFSLRLGLTELAGFPKVVSVGPGQASVASTVMRRESTALQRDGVAGEVWKVQILARDVFGTRCETAGDAFVLRVGQVDYQMSSLSSESGVVYSAEYGRGIPHGATAQGLVESGIHSVQVLLGNTLVPGTNVKRSIRAAIPASSGVTMSTYSPALDSATQKQHTVAGEFCSVHLFIRDAYNNAPSFDAKARQESFTAKAEAAGKPTIVCGDSKTRPCGCPAGAIVAEDSFCVVNNQDGTISAS